MNNENLPSSYDDLKSNASADAVHAVMQFLRLLLHRKMYVAGCLFVAGLLAAFYYFTATRIYEAHAQLLVMQSGNDVWSAQMTGQTGRDTLIPTYERLFHSAVVLEGAIGQLLKSPAASRIDFGGIPREKWVDVLRRNLAANAIRRTNVIEIRYRSKSPEAAETVVGTVVESYLAFMERNHKDVSAELVTILKQEREGVDKQLAQKQLDLLAAQKNAHSLGMDGNQKQTHPAVYRVIRLNESLVQVQTERIELEASLSALRTAIRDGSDLRQHLNAIEPLVGREMLLSALGLNPQDTETQAQIERQLMQDRAKLEAVMRHYGEAHPKVVENVQSIRNAEAFLLEMQTKMQKRLNGLDHQRLGPLLASMVEEKLTALWEHEAMLSRQYRQAESEAVQLNDRLAELEIMEHNVERLRNLDSTLLDRIANIDIGKDHSNVRVAVVTEPKASRMPVSPKLMMLGLLAIVGGVCVAVTLVYVLDVMDDRFRSPEELQEQLRAPMLAMIRELTAVAETGPDALQVHISPESVESEAFRTLRTTLAFSGQDLERLAITSTEPGDGKTTVLANLAVSYAQAGKRTLLIDCDLRRPGLTRLFEMRSLGGVSEVLRADEDIVKMSTERIQATGIERLDILPCGPKPSNPAELLSGPRLADMLGWADAHYDQVLIDCPPILAASDSAIVGRLSDSLILVIQPEKNHRRLVLRAVNGLGAIGVQIGGIVANKIRNDANGSYYGYGGYGYGYGYGTGYADNANDEDNSGLNVFQLNDDAIADEPDDHTRRAA